MNERDASRAVNCAGALATAASDMIRTAHRELSAANEARDLRQRVAELEQQVVTLLRHEEELEHLIETACLIDALANADGKMVL